MVRIAPDSHVTLHYRLATVVEGVEREVISTMGGKPATVQLGGGHLAEALEQRLLGLAEGDEASFDLPADEAFGRRSPDLVQSVARRAFDELSGPGARHAPGDVIELNRSGGRLVGVVKDCDERRVVVDFNHPLAGLPVRFAVRVIGVL